ncbi:MAG: hypothetical protein ACI8Q2_000151, partial [Candidatus Omnitrophota bacterium]
APDLKAVSFSTETNEAGNAPVLGLTEKGDSVTSVARDLIDRYYAMPQNASDEKPNFSDEEIASIAQEIIAENDVHIEGDLSIGETLNLDSAADRVYIFNMLKTAKVVHTQKVQIGDQTIEVVYIDQEDSPFGFFHAIAVKDTVFMHVNSFEDAGIKAWTYNMNPINQAPAWMGLDTLIQEVLGDKSPAYIAKLKANNILFHEMAHMRTIPSINLGKHKIFEKPLSPEQLRAAHEVSGLLAEIAGSAHAVLTFAEWAAISNSFNFAAGRQYIIAAGIIKEAMFKKLGIQDYVVQAMYKKELVGLENKDAISMNWLNVRIDRNESGEGIHDKRREEGEKVALLLQEKKYLNSENKVTEEFNPLMSVEEFILPGYTEAERKKILDMLKRHAYSLTGLAQGDADEILLYLPEEVNLTGFFPGLTNEQVQRVALEVHVDLIGIALPEIVVKVPASIDKLIEEGVAKKLEDAAANEDQTITTKEDNAVLSSEQDAVEGEGSEFIKSENKDFKFKPSDIEGSLIQPTEKDDAATLSPFKEILERVDVRAQQEVMVSIANQLERGRLFHQILHGLESEFDLKGLPKVKNKDIGVTQTYVINLPNIIESGELRSGNDLAKNKVYYEGTSRDSENLKDVFISDVEFATDTENMYGDEGGVVVALPMYNLSEVDGSEEGYSSPVEIPNAIYFVRSDLKEEFEIIAEEADINTTRVIYVRNDITKNVADYILDYQNSSIGNLVLSLLFETDYIWGETNGVDDEVLENNKYLSKVFPSEIEWPLSIISMDGINLNLIKNEDIITDVEVLGVFDELVDKGIDPNNEELVRLIDVFNGDEIYESDRQDAVTFIRSVVDFVEPSKIKLEPFEPGEEGVNGHLITATKNDAAVITKGGIDLDATKMNLEIEGATDVNCVNNPTHASCIQIKFTSEQIQQMRQGLLGFTPIITNIQPVVNLPFILGLADTDNNTNPLSQIDDDFTLLEALKEDELAGV